MSNVFDESLRDVRSEEAIDFGAILDEIGTLVERAKTMPLSSSAIVSRDELLSLVDTARSGLPGELQRARRLLQDRDEMRILAEREANELLDEARSQAAYLVQRTEVVRQARHHAERLIAEAEAEARRVQHEADDYVDRKLAAFEVLLDRTTKTVQAGRERLTVVPREDEPALGDVDNASALGAPEEGFFDQDLS
jgi:hypothetical protein